MRMKEVQKKKRILCFLSRQGKAMKLLKTIRTRKVCTRTRKVSNWTCKVSGKQKKEKKGKLSSLTVAHLQRPLLEEDDTKENPVYKTEWNTAMPDGKR
jgi:hypothetical protein